jgi:SAM-dependent methyltransferase
MHAPRSVARLSASERGEAMTAPQLTELKQQEREMWATGDYAVIARDLFWEAGRRIVERVGVSPGDRVLDVACGTGNAALRAARAGGRVTGLDLTPELLDVGRALAAEAGLEVEWIEGDAEAMPFEDGGFDVVLSTFGCMFAPRHQLAARELTRVLASGGRMGLCSWTPDSSIAEMIRTLMAVLPPSPEFAQPPPLWGSEEHVRGLFEASGLELELERESLEFRSDSVEHALRTYETTWGPFIKARELLAPEGRWPALRAELAAVLERRNTADGDALTYEGEYLVVIGRQRR